MYANWIQSVHLKFECEYAAKQFIYVRQVNDWMRIAFQSTMDTSVSVKAQRFFLYWYGWSQLKH